MKTLKNFINESREIQYRVQLIDAVDEDGIGINCTISIDAKDQKEFEKYLNDEQDNMFVHAEGGNVEY